MKKKVNLFFSNKKMQLVLVLIILMVAMLCFIANKNGFIGNIARNIRGELEEPEVAELFTYTMYDNQNEEKIKVLVKVQSEDGLDYIETPDNHKIQCNGKKVMALDYEVKKDKDYVFKVKESNKDVQEQNLRVDDEYIKSKILEVQNPTEGTGITTLQINRYMNFDDFTLYYKIGKKGQWQLCKNKEGMKIEKDDYLDLYEGNLVNEDDTITVDIKIVSKQEINKILFNKDYKINMQPQENIEDGIIQVIAKRELENDGHIEVTIGNETYAMHTYVFDGNQEWKEDQIFGDEEDIGNAKEYAKNMVVVKVNGNLTIDENVTVTAYNSSYGGPKGMLLYVTGDIINKGTISMTARGAKAKGQNVYLWKNTNGSCESIDATGGKGGASYDSRSLVTTVVVNGKKGNNGISRRTGGGGTGSGRSYLNIGHIVIGQGGRGTSYSGGSGSGAANTDGGRNQNERLAVSGAGSSEGGARK